MITNSTALWMLWTLCLCWPIYSILLHWAYAGPHSMLLHWAYAGPHSILLDPLSLCWHTQHATPLSLFWPTHYLLNSSVNFTHIHIIVSCLVEINLLLYLSCGNYWLDWLQIVSNTILCLLTRRSCCGSRIHTWCHSCTWKPTTSCVRPGHRKVARSSSGLGRQLKRDQPWGPRSPSFLSTWQWCSIHKTSYNVCTCWAWGVECGAIPFIRPAIMSVHDGHEE